MSAIALLCEMIGHGGTVSASSIRMKTGCNLLLHEGYIRESGVVQAVTCQNCDNPHDAAILFKNEQYGYICPDCGFVPVERSAVVGMLPDLPKLVAALANVFECKRRRATPLSDRTFRVGAIESVGGDVAIYFHPRLQSEQDVIDLETALSREIHSRFRLILTAEGALPFPKAKTARLDEVVEFPDDTGILFKTTDPLTIVNAPVRRVGGAPNKYAHMLIPLIQSRIQDGIALEGRNEEAKAILDFLRTQNPADKPPSLLTIKRYVTKIRGGS